MTFGRRILILVPHPDDEVVACAASIGRAQAQGSAIFALYLTHGCIARETLWPWQRRHYAKYVARRRFEAEKAAQFLNITPVGWSDLPARSLWRHLDDTYGNIRAAAETNNIDQLWIPAYEGGNADHDVTNALAAKWVSEDRGQKTEDKQHPSSVLCPPSSVIEFAEYNFHGGKACSQQFPFPNGSEQIVALTPEEQKRKRATLDIYKSERMNLNYVGTERECYRPLARYDYARPPHPGTLWYARFQWVPFRHPRVDFSDPRDVSRALTQFLVQPAA